MWAPLLKKSSIRMVSTYVLVLLAGPLNNFKYVIEKCAICKNCKVFCNFSFFKPLVEVFWAMSLCSPTRSGDQIEAKIAPKAAK